MLLSNTRIGRYWLSKILVSKHISVDVHFHEYQLSKIFIQTPRNVEPEQRAAFKIPGSGQIAISSGNFKFPRVQFNPGSRGKVEISRSLDRSVYGKSRGSFRLDPRSIGGESDRPIGRREFEGAGVESVRRIFD